MTLNKMQKLMMESCQTTRKTSWPLDQEGKWMGKGRAFQNPGKNNLKMKRKSLKLHFALLFPFLSWKHFFFFWNSTDMLIKLNNVPCTKFSVRDENCIRTCSNDALVFLTVTSSPQNILQQHPHFPVLVNKPGTELKIWAVATWMVKDLPVSCM